MTNPIHQWLEGKKKDIGYDEGQENPNVIDETWADMYDTKAEAWFAGFDNTLVALKEDSSSLLSTMEAEIRGRVESADNGTSNSQEVVALIDTIIHSYFNDIRG